MTRAIVDENDDRYVVNPVNGRKYVRHGKIGRQLLKQQQEELAAIETKMSGMKLDKDSQEPGEKEKQNFGHEQPEDLVAEVAQITRADSPDRIQGNKKFTEILTKLVASGELKCRIEHDQLVYSFK
jgi:hypothetical protein